MIFRKIQGTNFKSSILGYGTWGLAGNSYGRISKKESSYLLKHALSKQINYFDTSSLYGNGSVEKLLGETFSNYEKQKIIIATKIGMVENKKNIFLPKFDFKKENLQKEIFKSMRRLKTDSLDVLQLHSPKFSFIKSEKFLNVVDLLKENQKKGNIKYFGISVQKPEEAFYILKKKFNFSVIQINFNLLDMRAYSLGVFKLARKRRVSIITRTPMAMGLLNTNKIVIKKNNDHRIRFNRKNLELLRSVSKKYDAHFGDKIPLKTLALKFAVFDEIICSTLSGMMTKKEIDDNSQFTKSKFSIKNNLGRIKSIYRNYFLV